MSKWKKVRLGDVGNSLIGLTYKPEEVADNGTIVLRSGNIQDGKIVLNDVVKVSKNINSNLLLKNGDILICSRNGSANLVGKSAIIDNFLENVSFGAFMMVYRSPLNFFIKHFLQSGNFRKQLTRSATTTINQITKQTLDNILLPLPPLDIQKQIARELDTVSELLKLRKQQLEELDQLTKSVFYEMFGDPVRNEKGWEVKKVESICINIFGGGTPSKKVKEYYEGDIPWVTPKDMKSYWITDSEDHINELAITISSTRLVPSRSLLMVVRSGILKHTLPVAINLREVAINQDLKAFVFRDDVSVIYMLYLFKMIEKFLLKGVRSVTADNIEFNSIKGLSVPVPPTYEQSKFADIVTQIESQKALVKKAIDETQLLFDSLMSKYFDD